MPCILDSRNGCYGCRAAALNQSGQPINVTLSESNGIAQSRVPCSPYYTGPSGPVDAVPWCYRPCPPGVRECWQNEEGAPLPPHESPAQTPSPAVYGFFYQAGVLTLASPGCIPLSGSGATIQNVEQSDGIITLSEAGIYEVSYTLNLPASATCSGSISLLKNGSAVPGATIDLARTLTGSPLCVSARVLLYASSGTTLCLSLSSSLSISASAEESVLASLTLWRIA